jgi:hypothetical protein
MRTLVFIEKKPTPDADAVMIVLLDPAPWMVIFLSIEIPEPHVHEPDGMVTVSPLAAEVMADWTAD